MIEFAVHWVNGPACALQVIEHRLAKFALATGRPANLTDCRQRCHPATRGDTILDGRLANGLESDYIAKKENAMESSASQNQKTFVTRSALNDLLFSLAMNGVELTPEEYKTLERPKAEWPTELREKVRRFGGEDCP